MARLELVIHVGPVAAAVFCAGIVVEALFNAFATAAFFKFMIFSIFEMRYLLIIWKARRPQVIQQTVRTRRPHALTLVLSLSHAFCPS